MKKESDLDFLDFLAKKVVEEETGEFVAIPEKISLIDSCELVLSKSVEGAKIVKTIGDPFPSMGCIELSGKNITVKNVENFIAVSKSASNIDIYPLTNGEVKMDFTFHGVQKKIRS